MVFAHAPEKLRVLIVDDEPFAREKVVKYLQRETDIGWVGEAENGVVACDMIAEQQPDIVFLDIQMPERNGLEVLQRVTHAKPPLIVFVTAHDDFAVDAFRLHALDYLLKPYDHLRFAQALERAREQLKLGRTMAMAQQAIAFMTQWQKQGGTPQRLVIQKPNRAYFVSLADVVWFKADGRHALCRAAGENHPLKESLARLEARLDPARFQRVHRGTIVNLDHIEEIQNWFWGTYLLVMRDGSQIQSGRTYREKIVALLQG